MGGVLIFGVVFDFGTAVLLSVLSEVGPVGVSTHNKLEKRRAFHSQRG